MVVIRNVFLLTDVTGPFYTVVDEITAPNLAAFEIFTLVE